MRAYYALPPDYTEYGPLYFLMMAFIDRVAASGRMSLTKRTRRTDNVAAADDETEPDPPATLIGEAAYASERVETGA